MIFCLGFLLGIILAVAAMFIFWVKKSRLLQNKIEHSEQEKKLLNDKIAKSCAHIAALEEKMAHRDLLKVELESTKNALDEKRQENGFLTTKVAQLSIENEKTVEFFNRRIEDLSALQNNMKEVFASISKDALHNNADLVNNSFKQSVEHFFKIAEKDRLTSEANLAGIMQPLKDSLVAVDKKVQELETSRQGAYSGLKEQIEGMLKSQANLQKETQNLSRALYAPTIRGRWGEMQLKRVVELSGLSSYCDFVEQKNIGDGKEILRPDMIVTLPKNKKIVIDAKAPLDIFSDENLIAINDEQRGQDFAASLRRHLLALKKKSYYSYLGDSPEFVVMFLPSEAFIYWALMADPMLLDFAAQHEVIIATPITLVALLKAIAFGFKQEAIATNIEEVRRLSQELIDRVNKVSSHFEKLGKNLRQATESYNQTLSSLDSRVLVTARKLADIKSVTESSETMVRKTLPVIDIIPRNTDTESLVDKEDL